MDNKKLLKFLYKDIAEMEELVTEKGAEGFDEFEIDFIQSRFKGAKQIIQILSEKENKQLNDIRPRPVAAAFEDEENVPSQAEEKKEEAFVEQEEVQVEVEVNEEILAEKEVNEEISEPLVVDELKEQETKPSELQEVEAEEKEVIDTEQPSINYGQAVISNEQQKPSPEPPVIRNEQQVTSNQQSEPDVELEDENEVDEANHRLGDRFSKEKSVNELLGNHDNSNLEYKISNSPVVSIKAAIGINDRYQYIRELFEGNSDTFSKAVTELDNLNTIQDAVAYLQQNYKWKKNETSLKFVNLVKRRFANG